MRWPGRLLVGAGALIVAYVFAMMLGAERLGCWDPIRVIGPYGQVDEVLHCGEEFAYYVPALALGLLVVSGVLKVAQMVRR